MRFTPFLFLPAFLLLLLAPGCGSGEVAEEASSGPEAPSLSAAELRAAYLQYLAELTDTLPARQIVEPGKLYPVDEALNDTAFFVFRENLRAAVQSREILELLPHISDSIIGPGGEKGLEAFTGRWELESESKIRQSPLWEILSRVMGSGGAFTDGGRAFRAPYAYATFPRDTYDAAQFGAVTGAGVRMRASTSLNSTILTLVSHDIVPILEVSQQDQTIGSETYPWVKLRSPDGQEGFIWGKFVWHAGMFHAVFRQQQGVWQLTRLSTGP